MSDVPSISIGGISGGQNNIGKTEIAGDQVQNIHGAGEVTVPQFLEAMSAPESLPEDVAQEVMPEIHKFASLPPAEQEGIINSPKWMAIAERIQPHAGTVWKSVATFGTAALKALASRNPIISGVLAVCELHTSKKK